MNPTARTSDFTLEQRDDGTVLVASDGARHALSPLGAAIWQAADGTRSLEAVACRVGASVAEVGAELDRLADVGLLRARFAPPVDAPIARRSLLRTLASASLGGAVVLAAGRARAEQSTQKEREVKFKQYNHGLVKNGVVAPDTLPVRIDTAKASIEGELVPESLLVESGEKGERLSFVFVAGGLKTGSTAVVKEVKELADILKEQYAAKAPVVVSWGAEFENVSKGLIVDLKVGYSLYLENGTPARMEALLTVAS
jgi:hypothetical protein